jgi:hypothetical protein
VKADTSVATVPTGEEATGDFSQSAVNIFSPFSAHANPNYDPTKPVSKSNAANFRDPFPNNRIPVGLLNPAAVTMLGKYTPRPNTMDMGAMIMDGVPSVVGAGNDSNNFLGQRNERHFTDQGTLPHRPRFRPRRQHQRALLCGWRTRLHAAEPARVRQRLFHGNSHNYCICTIVARAGQILYSPHDEGLDNGIVSCLLFFSPGTKQSGTGRQ